MQQTEKKYRENYQQIWKTDFKVEAKTKKEKTG